MNRRRTLTLAHMSVLGALALIWLCMPLAAYGADRVVICEEFTATW